MIIVRNYRNSDYEAVKQNLIDGKLFSQEDDSHQILSNKIRRNPDSIIVAEIDGKVVGSVYVIYDEWGSFVFRLAVQTDFMKRGIGSVLLENAEKGLKDRGARDITLFVRDGEPELLDFYKKRGYNSMNKLHHVMTKRL